MSDEKLLPCPFCGSKASIFEDCGHSSAWEAGCYNEDCRVQPSVWEKTKAETIFAWNTRSDLIQHMIDKAVAQMKAERDAAVEALENIATHRAKCRDYFASATIANIKEGKL